ncbi:biorientation of chromosomes in cell division protein 1-like 1 [Bombina bombina]|uniref:biorientation of chromosomes in cell division protein 1-like 1 n=1 Tax=Bombina bombina TaxID=8345 RepID=UPI00235B2C16|nr:biorientation of chromosomes in cell division protein 1-like 1 [Bombina bombina]
MANLPPGDPKLVSQIVNHLKSQGLFDQFRRDCLADVDTKPAYQNLRQRVDNFVANHLANHTWSPHLNKNQLRNNIRQQVLKSGMLESGIDRIISQVVDPKINHIFRPQVEKVVQEFLASLNNKEDPNANLPQPEERSDTSSFVPGSMSTGGPSTSVANDAMSILETISSLNQEATAARAFTETANPKTSDKVAKKLFTQQSVDNSTEKDQNAEDNQDSEKSTPAILAEVTEPVVKQEDLPDFTPPAEDVQNPENEAITTVNTNTQSEELPNDSEELRAKVSEKSDKKTEISEKVDRKEEKKESKVEKRNDCTKKNDEALKNKDEKATKERESEIEPVKSVAPEKSSSKNKVTEAAKEELMVDSDSDAYSDITVSSVHTSDLSSFDEDSEGEEEVAASDSTEEGEITSDDEEKAKIKGKAKQESEQKDGKPKHTRPSYVHKPFLYSKYYSDSDDELTVEQRRLSVAKEKEERLLRRQVKREKLEEKRKKKAAEKSKMLKTANQGKPSTDLQSSSKTLKPKSSSIKEVLKEQMFLEKKEAMSKRKNRDSRPDKTKSDHTEQDPKDSQKFSESHTKTTSATKEAKHSTIAQGDNKHSRKLMESLEECKSDSRSEKEHKKKTSISLERVQQDHDTCESRRQVERLDSNSEEHQRQKSSVKPDKNIKKESNDTEIHSAKTSQKKETKSHRNERERTLSEDRSSSKHKSMHKSNDDSKRNIKDDGFQKLSQRKSSSEERSDRKNKQKSEGRSSSYNRDEKTSVSEHANKRDESVRKDSHKRDRERHQSTEKSRQENKFKRDLGDFRTHRDSQSTSRLHSTTPKRSKSYSEDKNETDSTNSDYSKKEDSLHKEGRQTQSCSEEVSKAKFKNNKTSLKINDQEEINQKTERDKTHVDVYMEKHRKSKSEDKDNEDKNENAMPQSSNTVTKESGYKSKYTGDKGRERSRSDNRDRASSKTDKKVLDVNHKSSNSKHSHKDLKHKEGSNRSEEKLSKYTDEKRIYEKRNSLDRKSSKKSPDNKVESSKVPTLKSTSDLSSAVTEKVKLPTSLSVSTEEKEMSSSNLEHRHISLDDSVNETLEKMDIENCLATHSQDINANSEVTGVVKTSTVKYKTQLVVKEIMLKPIGNVCKNVCVTKVAVETNTRLETGDIKASDIITPGTVSTVNSFKNHNQNMMSSLHVKADNVSNMNVINSETTSATKLSSEPAQDLTDVQFSEHSEGEQQVPEIKNTVTEPLNNDGSNLSTDDMSSEIMVSNDNEISTSDVWGKVEEQTGDKAVKKEQTLSTIFVSMDSTKTDDMVTGNDVEDDSNTEIHSDVTESNDKTFVNQNSVGVEETFDIETCTESKVESTIVESNTRENNTAPLRDRDLSSTSYSSSSTIVYDNSQKNESENIATSSSSEVEKSEIIRVIFSSSLCENAATSSSIHIHKGHNENAILSLINNREYAASTSAVVDGNFAEDEMDMTVLADNATEDATTSSSSYVKNCFEVPSLDTSFSSEKSNESAATSSQAFTDMVEEAEMSNCTLKAATSSSARASIVSINRATSENAQDNIATSSYIVKNNSNLDICENGIKHAATSSDNTTENDRNIRIYENVVTHLATSSSSVSDCRRESNFDVSLVSSEIDNENTAASSSNVMDSSMGEPSNIWLKGSVDRENENTATSSSSSTEKCRNIHNEVFGNVEDSKNARATSSTQHDTTTNHICVHDLTLATPTEYPANSSDFVMDSSTEVLVSVSSEMDSRGTASCSSSGREQIIEDQDLGHEREKDNNMASSSSALVVCMEDNSNPVVPSFSSSAEAASSSSYMDSSTEHMLIKSVLSSDNTEAAASSSITLNSSTKQVAVASIIFPGNSNDNTATSSSSSSNHCLAPVNLTNNTHATASSSVTMDSSTEEDSDTVDIEGRSNAASSSSSDTLHNNVHLEQKVVSFITLPEKRVGATASSSTAVSSRSKEQTETIVSPDKSAENAASSSDSKTTYNKSYDVLANNNTACASTSSNYIQRFTENSMDEGNVCFEMNSEATEASSSNAIEFISDDGGDNATSSGCLIGNKLESEKVSRTTYQDKNAEAASSSMVFTASIHETRTDESFGRQSLEDATTSSSTERENENNLCSRSADVEMCQNNESRPGIIEAAAESSFIASGSDTTISGTSEEAAAVLPVSRANEETELAVMDSDLRVNNLNYERIDEKEDAVSSASSAEQIAFSNGSTVTTTAGDGEIDGAVTSAGAEISESSQLSEQSEAFAHVSCVNIEDAGNGSNLFDNSSEQEATISHNSRTVINESLMSGANVDLRDLENDENCVLVENAHYETLACVATENEAETQVNVPVLEEGEGAVTSTGIEENDDSKVSIDRGQDDTSCSGMQSEGSVNVVTSPENQNCTVTEDDESAITSTGAKEDEEEGEGFVTSTGTANEDSSFSAVTEENSNSAGINVVENIIENIDLSANTENREYEINHTVDDIMTNEDMNSQNRDLQNSIKSEVIRICEQSIENSGEDTIIISNSLPTNQVLDSEREGTSDLDITFSDRAEEQSEEPASELNTTLVEHDAAMIGNECIIKNSSDCIMNIATSYENLDSRKDDIQDNKNINQVPSKDNTVVDSNKLSYTSCELLKNDEHPISKSESQCFPTDTTASATNNTVIDEGSKHLEDNTESVTALTTIVCSVEETVAEPNDNISNVIKERLDSPEDEDNGKEVLCDTGAAEVLPNDELGADFSEKSELQEVSGAFSRTEDASNSIAFNSSSVSNEDDKGTAAISSEAKEIVEKSNNHKTEDQVEKPKDSEEVENHYKKSKLPETDVIEALPKDENCNTNNFQHDTKSDQPNETSSEKDQTSDESAHSDSAKIKRPSGQKRAASCPDGQTASNQTEKNEIPVTVIQEDQKDTLEKLPEELHHEDQNHQSEHLEQEVESLVQSSEDTEETTPVQIKKRRGRKSLAQLKEESSKEDDNTKTEELTHLKVKPEEEDQPKIETEKRKRGRPPKNRNLTATSNVETPVKQESSEEGTNVQKEAVDSAHNKQGTPELENKKDQKSTHVEPEDKSFETVHRQERKPKRLRSSSGSENGEPDKKNKKSESDEEEEEEGDAGTDDEEEEEEEDDDEHKGATTRAASRLEAQRNQPHKPTTRAASKLSSPNESSAKQRKRKEKSLPESKSSKNTPVRSKTPQTSTAKRKRESSPAETPAKRTKRQ